GALAALTGLAYQRKTKEVVDAGRAYLEEQFRDMQLGFVPGAANFVMVNVRDGAAVFKKLLAHKIIVRPLKGYNLREWVRISVGTMKQNKKCIAALKEVLSQERRAAKIDNLSPATRSRPLVRSSVKAPSLTSVFRAATPASSQTKSFAATQ